jgi:hypothetical protein
MAMEIRRSRKTGGVADLAAPVMCSTALRRRPSRGVVPVLIELVARDHFRTWMSTWAA